MTLPVVQPEPVCGSRCRCVRRPDPLLLDALRAHLSQHCLGRENAATWEQLLCDLNRYPYHVTVKVVRRVQEAADALKEEGLAIVGLSSGGVFVAQTLEELDEAIAEKRKRARSSFHSLRLLKRARARFLGQVEVAA